MIHRVKRWFRKRLMPREIVRVSLAGVVFGFTKIRFTQPVECVMRYEDDVWTCRDEYNISGHGETLSDAYGMYRESWIQAWRLYACADPESMTKDAQEWARQLREIIEEVD